MQFCKYLSCIVNVYFCCIYVFEDQNSTFNLFFNCIYISFNFRNIIETNSRLDACIHVNNTLKCTKYYTVSDVNALGEY